MEAKKRLEQTEPSKRGKAIAKFNKEKLLQDEKVKDKNDKVHKSEMKKQDMEMKQNRKIKVLVELYVKEALQNLQSEFSSKFESMLKQMKTEGKLYGAKFLSIPLVDFRMEKLKTLGKKGWKFAFIVDSKTSNAKDQVVLTREISLGGEDE